MLVKDIQYVTDTEGRRTAVLMPIEQYEALEELLIDMRLGEEARVSLADEERLPWVQVQFC